MLRIRNRSLAGPVQTGLEGYQAEVDALATYPERVEAGKRLFKSRNRDTNPVFRVVRQTLQGMSSGNNRCMYCEDSSAYQIDHFKPKDFYPEDVFDWDNYVWSCGPCNLGKSNCFWIIRRGSGALEEVRRGQGQPVVQPPAGRPAYLNPRRETPHHFMRLDLRDTFLFLPTATPGTLEYERTNRTITIFGLNERADVVQGRRNACGNYVARLEQYANRKGDGASPHLLGRLRNAMLRLDHRTVWAEMQRQQHLLPRLRPLFEAAPEALDW